MGTVDSMTFIDWKAAEFLSNGQFLESIISELLAENNLIRLLSKDKHWWILSVRKMRADSMQCICVDGVRLIVHN